MAKTHKHYILTSTAADDFRHARQWSTSRWGPSLTKQYFIDLHEAAERIAKNNLSLAQTEQLTGTTNLGIYTVREHYMVYLPMDDNKIIIVALIRQSRDVPSILQANNYIIRREIRDIFNKNKN